MSEQFLGIDFSGGSRPWREGVKSPTVWIATAEIVGATLALVGLVPVQDLPGNGQPFDRLTQLLSKGDYAAAAIDAPFSIPLAHAPPGGHRALLDAVLGLPNGADRPFPYGAALVTFAETVCRKATPKPLRVCERFWTKRSVNTRSTLWNGPRGGAPFAAACMALIARSGRPCWPWARAGRGLLVEGFPAAQLNYWDLPHQGYSGSSGAPARDRIVAALSSRISLQRLHVDLMIASPDALDAVIAVFGAVAAFNGSAIQSHQPDFEGCIAVHP